MFFNMNILKAPGKICKYSEAAWDKTPDLPKTADT